MDEQSRRAGRARTWGWSRPAALMPAALAVGVWGCASLAGIGGVTFVEAGADGGAGTDATTPNDARGDARKDVTTGSGSGGGDASVCTPGTQQCSGAAAIVTCGGDGQWGKPWTCASGCNGGACTGATTSGTSCQGGGDGVTSCGASGESCCMSLEVPGGTYYRTYTNTGLGPTQEQDPASVSGFRLDKYLVTVGRFRKYVSAWNDGAGYTPAAGSGKHTHLNGGLGLSVGPNVSSGQTYEPGWASGDSVNVAPSTANLTTNCIGPALATWTDTASAQENLPMNCVNWWEAYAFCIWDGGFLPSEAEWELAAAGGSEQREYPWGTTDPGTTNQYAIYGDNYPPPDAGSASALNIAPVGTATLGVGLWGQLDLEGDVGVWSMDDWDGTSPYVGPCRDCADLTAPSPPSRVVQGGYYQSTAQGLLPPLRFADAPFYRGSDVGFRCARSP